MSADSPPPLKFALFHPPLPCCCQLPSDPRLYREVNGEYYFVGDPAPFDYDGPRYSYYGPHPIADADVNFGSPTYWHARAYGLLAANPFGVRLFTGDGRQNGSHAIPAGESLRLRYRVLIHHADPSHTAVAESYRQFVAKK